MTPAPGWPGLRQKAMFKGRRCLEPAPDFNKLTPVQRIGAAAMSKPLGTIIILLVASLIVGWILKALDLDAQDLLLWIGGFADTLMDIFAGFLGWAAGPILVGAVVVVPIWLLRVIWKKAANRRRSSIFPPLGYYNIIFVQYISPKSTIPFHHYS
jgi:hypothetical protein